jgi:hypothetical protein
MTQAKILEKEKPLRGRAQLGDKGKVKRIISFL